MKKLELELKMRIKKQNNIVMSVASLLNFILQKKKRMTRDSN